MRMAIGKRKVIGYVITPQGTIEDQSIEPEASILWGATDKVKGRAAWLIPDVFRHGLKTSFILLPTTSLQTVGLPGDRELSTTLGMVQRAFDEQYDKKTIKADKLGKNGQMILIMVILSALTLALVGMMFAMGLPTAIAKFSGVGQ